MSADRHITSHTLCNERIAELEAELEALKARRCEMCLHYHVSTKWCRELTRRIGIDRTNFSCSKWAARS